MFSPPSQLALVLRSDELLAPNLDSLQVWMLGEGALLRDEGYLWQSLRSVWNLRAWWLGLLWSRQLRLCWETSMGCVSLKIVDTDGQSLKPNERGEVCIRSVIPMLGYFKNPEATEKSFVDSW